MSFYQDPSVDENSKRSEEFVNAVKSLFTRKKDLFLVKNILTTAWILT